MLRLTILCFTLLIAACSGGNEARLSLLSQDAVILAFGDSLTYGTGTSAESSYPAQLAQLSGRTVINAGIPGELTAGGLSRIRSTLNEYEPQLLLLCLGGNDMLRRKSFATIEGNLKQIVDISRSQGVPVLLIGVPRPALFGLESAEFYYSLAEKMQLPLEAEIIPEVLSQRELRSDQIHPNTEGYRLVAEAIHAKLKESGAL